MITAEGAIPATRRVGAAPLKFLRHRFDLLQYFTSNTLQWFRANSESSEFGSNFMDKSFQRRYRTPGRSFKPR
jgi:hypothetical protein